jgi:hypothetical protein
MANSVISNLITTNITQNGGIDRITATEVRSVLNAINSFIQDDISYGTAIPFDRMVSRMAAHTVSSPITFTKNTTGAVPGGGTILDLAADGTNIPDFSAFEESTASSGWVNTAGVVNTCIFFYTGTKWFITIIQTAGGGAVALNTPGSFAAVPGASGEVVLTWTDTNSSPNEVGYKIYWNAINDFASAGVVTTTAANVTTYTKTGLGSGTWYFWIKAVGDGTTTTDSDTTSASSTAGTGTALNAPTGVTLGTATSSTQPLTWTDTNSSPNENGYKVYYNTANNFGTASLATTTAANATSYTVTGLTASTTYYYWVVAAGNGTTTSDSSPSTVQSGSTGSAGLDSDAAAYITAEETAASITIDTTNRNAISALFTSLKGGANSWLKIKQIMLGYGTGLVNGKSPGTLNATATNAPTIGSTGYTFDGVNDALNTNITPNANLASDKEFHAFYIKSSTDDKPIAGSLDSGNGTYIFPRSTTHLIYRIQTGSDKDAGVNSTAVGRYVFAKRFGITPLIRVTKDGTQIDVNSTATTALSTYPIYIGALNDSGTIGSFNACTIGIYIIGDDITDTQMGEIDSAIQTFITATSRT